MFVCHTFVLISLLTAVLWPWSAYWRLNSDHDQLIDGCVLTMISLLTAVFWLWSAYWLLCSDHDQLIDCCIVTMISLLTAVLRPWSVYWLLYCDYDQLIDCCVLIPPHSVYPQENTEGLRRSQRTRVRPLEWYKNERIIYDRRKSGDTRLSPYGADFVFQNCG